MRAAAAAATIEVEHLHKRFGAVTALADVSLSVGAGSLKTQIGANGAGKTTLLRILATTLTPDEGQARVAGHDVQRRPREARSLAGLVLGEERSWYWRLSGRENLHFFAALHGLRRPRAAARATALLDELGLAESADRRVSDYSSGMRARLALARALLAEPPVLLLDEPTRSLDPAASDAFRARIAAIGAAQPTCVLLATHNIDDARLLATRTLLLSGGSLVAEADAQHVDDLVRQIEDVPL